MAPFFTKPLQRVGSLAAVHRTGEVEGKARIDEENSHKKKITKVGIDFDSATT